MSRTIKFDPDEICDGCGAQGAFDFRGDCVCPDCIHEMKSFFMVVFSYL